MKRVFNFAAMILAVVMLCGISEAVIRDGAIHGKSGLSFGSVSYAFNSLTVTIRNSTKYNVNFGGAMVFLDRHYNVVARAELLTAKIKRRSARKYKAFFSYGTGEEAKSARYLEWEF